MNAKCFFIEPTGQVERYLRRYHSNCPAPWRFLNGMTLIGTGPEDEKLEVPHSDERWPKVCDCGFVFEEHDPWQVFTEHLYKRADTGETTTLRFAHPGAMWFADWFIHSPNQNWYRGPDGHCLVIRGFYGRDFVPDQRASNCTKPDDDTHKCWVRTGTVPNITINKGDGSQATCGAGAGSFFCGPNKEWHGFVERGELVQR